MRKKTEQERADISRLTREGLKKTTKRLGRPPNTYTPKLDPFRADIIAEREKGKTFAQIARKYGVTRQTVAAFLK
jgi:DNA invertase Pin-like site-specific DNA recombinase